MTIVNRTTLYSYFQTGDKPSQQNFTDLIDSYLSLASGLSTQTVQSPVAFSAITLDSVTASALTVTGQTVLGSAQSTRLVVTGQTTLASAAGLTRTVGDNSTNLATTAFVVSALGNTSLPLVLLATTSANGASSVIFNNVVITSAYADYEIRFNGVFSSVNNDDLLVTLSINNASTFLATNYSYENIQYAVGGTIAGDTASSTTSLRLFNSATSPAVKNQSTLAAAGVIRLSNLLVSAQSNVTWLCGSNGNTGGYISGNGTNSNVVPINAIKLASGSGNLSGKFNLFGYVSA